MKHHPPLRRLTMSRRQFLKASAAGGASLLLPYSLAPGIARADPLSVTHFMDPLPIPRNFSPAADGHYYARMRELKHTIHSEIGPVTTVWGFGDDDGFSYPGPSFDVMTGQTLNVHWINELASTPDAPHYLSQDQDILDHLHGAEDRRKVSIHLHGGEITAATDGLPDDFFYPGGQRHFPYDLTQPATTLWYHDHAIGMTRLNVMMGLAGFFVLRDASEMALIHAGQLPPPGFEIPLVFQDRRIDSKGKLKYTKNFDDSFLGDVMLVNGRAWPHLEVQRRQYRFRLLNGSNTRTYTLQLDNGGPAFWQIGTDQGFLAAPAQINQITLTPGERADVVIDFAQFAAGDDVILYNTHVDMDGMEYPITDVMQFRIRAASEADPVALPAALRTIERLDENQAANTRYFKLEDFDDPHLGSVALINGLHFHDVTDVVRDGDTEVWTWVNKTDMIHPMHIHLVQFQVLDRYRLGDGKTNGIPNRGERLDLDPGEMGWKDTVRVGGLEIVRVIARFKGKASGLPSEHFPFHCHVLEHEDHDMMRQFRLDYA